MKYENNENENICKSGRRVWMLWRNLPVSNDVGEFTEILTVGIDITDRKPAEERLRENEQNLRQILENSPIGVAIVSKQDYERRYMNPRFLELMGAHSEDQLIGARQEDSYVDPADFERVRKASLRSTKPTKPRLVRVKGMSWGKQSWIWTLFPR